MALFKKEKKTSEKYEETSVKKRNNRFTMFDTLNFYTKLLAEYREHDDLPEDSLGKGMFYYTPESIVTANGIKKMFFIEEFPLEMPRYFLSDLRDAVAQTTYNFNMANNSKTKVSINIIQDADWFDLNFGNFRIKGVWASFTRQYERVKKEMDDEMDLKNALNTDKYSKQVVKKVNSFLHIKEAKERKSSFFKTKVIIEIVSRDSNTAMANDALKDAEKTLREFFIANDIRAKRTFLDAHNYQKNYSPAGTETKSLIRKKFKSTVWSDDTLTSFVIPEHGIVGDTDGIPFGVDVINGETISFNMKRGTDGRTALVTASSGEGKSYFCKMLYTFSSGDPDTDVVVFDWEGSEYHNLGVIADAKEVSMNGTYVNTMVIAKPTGNFENDKLAKQSAIETTTTVFNVLADPQYGMSTKQKAIFSDLIAKAYSNVGVGENMDTWHYSESLNYFKLYDILVNEFILGSNKTAIDNHTIEELKDFRNVLKPYFEENGIYSQWFKYPLSFNDFIDSKNVIFSFGMGNKAEILTDERQITLAQLYAAHLTTLKASYNKARGRFTTVFIEELQRYIMQPYSGTIVKSFVTGGRKLGLINFLITNDPSGLVAGSDIDSPLVQDNLSAVMSNVKMQCIGAIPERDMANLIDLFGLEKSEGFLMELANVYENSVSSGGYKHAFYVKYRGECTIVKAISSPALEDLNLYETDVNTSNEDLRSAKIRSDSDLEFGIEQAYQQDGEWDRDKKTYTDITGKQIEQEVY